MAEEKTCNCDKRPWLEKLVGKTSSRTRKFAVVVMAFALLAVVGAFSYGIATGTIPFADLFGGK